MLTPTQFKVLRRKATEPRKVTVSKGGWDDHYAKGTYVCTGCRTPLYTSEMKFDCGCGWPVSFFLLGCQSSRSCCMHARAVACLRACVCARAQSRSHKRKRMTLYPFTTKQTDQGFWTNIKNNVYEQRDADGFRCEILCAECNGYATNECAVVRNGTGPMR